MAKVSLKRILLALVLVMGLTGAVLMLVVWPRYKQAHTKTPETDSIALRAAIEQWASQKHRCPTVQELVDDQFLDPGFATDPWGGPYLIECQAELLKIHSRGPDHRLDTQDDVVMRKRKQR
jgi:hypothetical protein